ncbi:MAG TPA: hypothetical protein VFW40_06455 [Capsulimonadaceae bacterium]|nr:hypothetical protein [Capsulimonadaceae bacterium]
MQKRTAKGGIGPAKSKEIFDQLIALNREAFERDRFSTAYHALAAALHWADEENDERQLATVEKLAKEQLNWIDLHAPNYQHSSQSAALRGHTNIYSNLERQARSAQLRISSRRQFEQMLGTLPTAEFLEGDEG